MTTPSSRAVGEPVDAAAAPGDLMLVSTRADERLRADVAAGRRSRPEYLVLEADHGVELLDWTRMRRPPHARTRVVALRQAAAGLRRASGVRAVLSDGEHVGIPLGLALGARAGRPGHVVIGHRLTTTAKRRLLERATVRDGIDLFVVHSDTQAALVTAEVGLDPGKIRVLPYGVDTTFWTPQDVPEERLIVSAGREHRDYDVLARAVADLDVQGFVADGSAHSPGAQRRTPAEWPDNLDRGRLSPLDLRDRMARAAVAVVPVIETDFPAGITVVVEAMSMGKPVIVTATAGMRGALPDPDAVVWVPPGDAAALRAAVVALLDDPARRASLGAAARRAAVAHHDVRDFAAGLAACLAESATTQSSSEKLVTESSAPGRVAPASAGRTAPVPAAGPARRRLLVVSPDLPYPPDWGFAKRVFELSRRLARTHDVTVVSYVRTSHLDQVAELRRHVDRVVVVPHPEPGERSKRLRQMATFASSMPFHAGGLRTAALQAAVDRELAAGDVDLVQLESSQLGWLRLDAGIPVVVDEHNVESELLERMGRTEASPVRRAFNAREARRYRRFEDRVWAASAGCLTTSERDAEAIAERGPDVTCAVVPNGVDVDEFRPTGEEPRPDTLVFIGKMNYRPNIDGITWFLDEIFPAIQAARPGVRLTVVGDGPADVLEGLRRPGVLVTGRVPDVRPILGSAAVAVVPLRAGGGTRLKVVDAMAMGVPMVSTSIGAEGIDVVDGEHIVLADAPADFARAVVDLLPDAPRRAAMAAAARELAVARYSWDTAAAGLEALHDRVLGVAAAGVAADGAAAVASAMGGGRRA